MKNIQDVMIEMDNLSEEITTKMAEEKEEAKEEFVVDEAVAEEACAHHRPPMREKVEFCCTIGLPNQHKKHHILDKDEKTKILFDLSCLEAIIVQKCISGCPKYEVKIVGCIPFTVNVPIRKKDDQCIEKVDTKCHHWNGMEEGCEEATETLEGIKEEETLKYPHKDHIFLCCSNSVCVNKTICVKCTRDEAAVARFILEEKLENCKCVKVKDVKVCEDKDDCLITVKGKFELPNCNMPTGIMWDCNPPTV
ncbi:hypothetical protein QJR52_11070 [Clostridium baratii]|uniref:hypothetical protein n=1 Tax=Clostridium baratii TaxID=1561 RepID=UPI0030CF78C3